MPWAWGKWNIAVHMTRDVNGSHLEFQVFKWFNPHGGFPIPNHHLEQCQREICGINRVWGTGFPFINNLTTSASLTGGLGLGFIPLLYLSF